MRKIILNIVVKFAREFGSINWIGHSNITTVQMIYCQYKNISIIFNSKYM